MGVVEAVVGIVFDASVLLPYREGSSLQPSAQSLLRRLRHSGIRTGILCGEDLSDDEGDFLKSMAMHYSCDHFLVGASSSAIDEVNAAWNDIGGTILFVISNNKKDEFNQLATSGWFFLILDVEGAGSCPNSNGFQINKLEELPLTICNLNKKAIGSDVVTVAYIMKTSREEDFAKRGAFPIQHTPNGLIFLPITFELPLSSQLQEADVILHKATDEILSIDLSSSSESPNRIIYTRGMQELQSYMNHHPECIAIDPLNNIYPVLDRLKIQQLLLGLEDLKFEGRFAIRGPHFLKIDDFNAPGLIQRLAESKLSLPSIVKPQVACGVADAHSMAVVFRNEDFKDLNVPCPAVVQEYVDHSSTLFKFYVLGEKLFYAVKKSTPNANTLMKLSHGKGPGPLHFDSLKSLPTSDEHAGNGSNDESLDLKLVTDAAIWLAKMLDLTIFGFDVVIQEGTGDHVIVDVNYLPSFKEVPDDIAIPAFWDAIKNKFESKKSKQCTVSNC